MDDFYEKLVKKNITIIDIIITILFILGSVILAFFILPVLFSFIPALSSLWPVALAGIIFLLYKLITARAVEYEYILTAGELDIDIIIARRKRKRLLTIHSRKFEVLAPYKEKYINEYKIESLKKLDYTANINNPANYFAIFAKEGEKICVIFEPSGAMVKKIRTIIPRNVILD